MLANCLAEDIQSGVRKGMMQPVGQTENGTRIRLETELSVSGSRVLMTGLTPSETARSVPGPRSSQTR